MSRASRARKSVGSQRLRALVVDDDALARRSVGAVLAAAGVTVVAEARDGIAAVRLCRERKPDVVMMDVVLPGLDGISATREIMAEQPHQLVIMLTTGDEDELGVLALRAGAVGFVKKDVAADALPKAIDAALRGEAAISRRLTTRVVEQLRGSLPPEAEHPQEALTAREWQVVELMERDCTTEQMARALEVSRETVRTHVKHILHKLGVSSRADALTRLHDEERDRGRSASAGELSSAGVRREA